MTLRAAPVPRGTGGGARTEEGAMDPFPGGASAVTTILVVRDVASSVAWYRDVLGAEVARTYDESAVLSLLGAWFVLVPAGEPTPDKPGVRFAPPDDPDRVSCAFTIRVEDCRTAHRALTARGAAFLTPPYDRGGEIRCFLRDPDGHLLEISEI